MFTAILWIVGVLVIVGSIGYFIYTYSENIIQLWDWVCETVVTVYEYVPEWLLPFLLVIVAVAVVSLIIKLL